MSASLLVLCLAAFAMVAAGISGVTGLALPWLDRGAAKLAPRHRARLWLGLAAVPALLGGLAVAAALLPALGVSADHCLAHGLHHPHLCPHHLGGAPGLGVVVLALLLSSRAAYLLARFGRHVRLGRVTSRTLAQASEPYADALVFPDDAPQAFVLGTLRPRLHVSRGLLALGAELVEAVLAHERVHARRRDLLWRALLPVLAVGHLPAIAAALRGRLAAAQELAADAEAAEALPHGPVKLAEALVQLARSSRAPAPGISITHGDLRARVHALLEGRRRFSRWPARLVLLAAMVLPVALGAAHDLVHHGLETLLGALS